MFLCTADDAFVAIQVQWGLIEILAFGDVDERWIMHTSSKESFFATPGLHLRLTERKAVVHVLCVSECEFVAWIPEQEAQMGQSYCEAICRALFGVSPTDRKSPLPTMARPELVFTSILNHFVVGTPQRTRERYSISVEGERLRAPPLDSAFVGPSETEKRALPLDSAVAPVDSTVLGPSETKKRAPRRNYNEDRKHDYLGEDANDGIIADHPENAFASRENGDDIGEKFIRLMCADKCINVCC
jgi:hypothetical protein